MTFDEGKWFAYLKGASFLIKPLDAGRVLDLDQKRKGNELSNEQMLEELFRDSLLGWEGVEGLKRFDREEELKILFSNSGIRDFVLRQATSLLEQETKILSGAVQILERKLFKKCSSQLKS